MNRDRTFSQKVSSKNTNSNQIRESYTWHITSDEDRSDFLSISQSRPEDELMHANSGLPSVGLLASSFNDCNDRDDEDDDITETDNLDRETGTEIQTSYNITESIV